MCRTHDTERVPTQDGNQTENAGWLMFRNEPQLLMLLVAGATRQGGSVGGGAASEWLRDADQPGEDGRKIQVPDNHLSLSHPNSLCGWS